MVTPAAARHGTAAMLDWICPATRPPAGRGADAAGAMECHLKWIGQAAAGLQCACQPAEDSPYGDGMPGEISGMFSASRGVKKRLERILTCDGDDGAAAPSAGADWAGCA